MRPLASKGLTLPKTWKVPTKPQWTNSPCSVPRCLSNQERKIRSARLCGAQPGLQFAQSPECARNTQVSALKTRTLDSHMFGSGPKLGQVPNQRWALKHFGKTNKNNFHRGKIIQCCYSFNLKNEKQFSNNYFLANITSIFRIKIL
mgnify:CR=1 FL=1